MATFDDIKGDIEEQKRRDALEPIRGPKKGSSTISSLLEKYGDIDESEEYKSLKEAHRLRQEQDISDFCARYSNEKSGGAEEKLERLMILVEKFRQSKDSLQIWESESYKEVAESIKLQLEQVRASFIEKYSNGESSIDEEMILERIEAQLEAHEKRDRVSIQKAQIKKLQEKSQQASKMQKFEH